MDRRAAAQDCRRYLLHGNLTFDSLHKLTVRLDNLFAPGRSPRTIYYELPSVLKHDPVLAHEVSWACRQWRSQDDQDICADIVGRWGSNSWNGLRLLMPESELDLQLFLWPDRNSTDREEKLRDVNCRLVPCKAKIKKLSPFGIEINRLLLIENKPQLAWKQVENFTSRFKGHANTQVVQSLQCKYYVKFVVHLGLT